MSVITTATSNVNAPAAVNVFTREMVDEMIAAAVRQALLDAKNGAPKLVHELQPNGYVYVKGERFDTKVSPNALGYIIAHVDQLKGLLAEGQRKAARWATLDDPQKRIEWPAFAAAQDRKAAKAAK